MTALRQENVFDIDDVILCLPDKRAPHERVYGAVTFRLSTWMSCLRDRPHVYPNAGERLYIMGPDGGHVCVRVEYRDGASMIVSR